MRQRGWLTSRSPLAWIAIPTASASDDDGSVPSVWTDCRTGRGRVARAVFPPEQVADVVAVACELPASHERPLGRFSRTELHRLVIEEGVCDALATTIWRWLQSQLQALARRHQTMPAAPGRPARVEFEYRRGGTLAYLAAWDVHHARLFGRCEPKTGIELFGRLVEQVMSTEPYASARRVFWIVDNGSSHAGQRSIDRLQNAYRNARLIHLPVHASWLNQIEIYFSILQRKAITPNDFEDLDALAARITAFEEHYRQIAQPFAWTFTRAKLDALRARLASREPHLRLAA